MFMLRRTALRAALAAAKPAPSVVVPKTRTFVSLNQSKLQSARQWSATSMQKRFASEDVKPVKEQVEAEEKAAEDAAVQAATADSTAAVNEIVEEVAVAEPEAAETIAAMESNSSAADAATAIAGAAAASAGSAAVPSEVPAANGQPAANSTLYVGNIFFEVNEQALQDYFSRFGDIKTTKIVYDARGLSKGFGYVEFNNVDDATKAIEAANQQVFQGRRLAVQFHRPRQAINRRQPGGVNPPSKTLFIGNMSFEMSDKDLSDLFREVRNVIDVRIAIDRRTGQPRGFAHADFIDVNSAMRAMDFLKGKELYGRQLRVDYSMSTPRSPDSQRR